MKVGLHNLEAKKTGNIELPESIFKVEVKPELLHEVFVAISNNQRQPWAHSKDRSEVRGGGKKPWKQKGTGRARHGSSRSPIWVGGGVTFGPRNERNYKVKINKKVKQKALKMALSDKVENKVFWVVENFDFEKPKTKLFAEFLDKMPTENTKSFIILTKDKDDSLIKMTGNLQKVDVVRAQDINVHTLLNHQGVIISKDGVDKLVEILNKNNKKENKEVVNKKDKSLEEKVKS